MDVSASDYPERNVWYRFEAESTSRDSILVETFKSDDGKTLLVKVSTSSY